jgi:hypothetical protein
MDKEYVEELAGQLVQALVDHEFMDEKYRNKAKCVLGMVLHKELVAPLEKVCMQIDEKKLATKIDRTPAHMM